MRDLSIRTCSKYANDDKPMIEGARVGCDEDGEQSEAEGRKRKDFHAEGEVTLSDNGKEMGETSLQT